MKTVNALFVGTLFLSLAAHAELAPLIGGELSYDQCRDLISGPIQNNNVEQMKAKVGARVIPAKCNHLMEKALEPVAGRQICRTDIVLFLLSKGVKPYESEQFVEQHLRTKNLSKAFDGNCDGIVEGLIPHMTPQDIALGTMRFDLVPFFQRVMGGLTSESEVPKAGKIRNMLLEANKALCDKGEAKNCDAVAHIKENDAQLVTVQQQADGQAADNQNGNSAKGEICRAMALVDAHKATMAKERSIGSVAGYVDAGQLHESARSIVELENHIVKMKQEYKAKSGKGFGGCNE